MFRKSLVTASAFALATGLMAQTATAAPITFLQFTQDVLGQNFTFTNNNLGVTTIASTQEVDVTIDPSFCLVAGCGGVTNGVFDLTLTATSSGPATTVNGGADINQNFNGTISITDGAVNLLTVTFTDLFAGSVNGNSPTLAASQPPDTFIGSSTVFDPLKLGIPRGFSLSFSSFECLSGTGLAIVNGSVCSATAAGTGTFAATPLAAPEPASMVLFGLGLFAAANRVRRRK